MRPGICQPDPCCVRERCVTDAQAVPRGEGVSNTLLRLLGVDRWTTFDCYGTLIDWNAGIRAALAGIWPDDDPDALLASYHEVETGLEAARVSTDVEPAAALGLPCVWINRLGESGRVPRAAELPDLSALPATLERLVPAG